MTWAFSSLTLGERGSVLSCMAVLCVVAGVGLGTAHAQPERRMTFAVRDRTNGAERCFDAGALQQRVAHYANTRSLAASELALELHVDAADSAELWVYRGAEVVSRRRFENLPASCLDRRDAVALSIALALDGLVQASVASQGQNPSSAAAPAPTVAGTESSQVQPAERPAATPARDDEADEDADTDVDEDAPQPSAAESPEPEPDTPEAEPVADMPESAASSGTHALELRVQPHLGGRLLAGAVPSAVWMGALGAEVSLNPWLAVDVSAFASTVGNSAFANARVEVRVLGGGELLGCGELELGDFAAQGCAGAIAAACRAQGFGYPRPTPSAVLPWAAASARLALRWPRDSWISVRLVAQSHVNLVRPELHVDGTTDQLTPGWLGASAGLDVIVSLN